MAQNNEQWRTTGSNLFSRYQLKGGNVCLPSCCVSLTNDANFVDSTPVWFHFMLTNHVSYVLAFGAAKTL